MPNVKVGVGDNHIFEKISFNKKKLIQILYCLEGMHLLKNEFFIKKSKFFHCDGFLEKGPFF